MFIHYLKSSFRYMRRFAMQNIISMVGLAAGFVAYAFSSLWTGYVNSYDTFHKDADRIYTFSHHEDGKTSIGNERARAGNGDAFYFLFREFERRNMLDSLGIESIMYSYFQEYPVNDKGAKCLDIDSAFINFFNPILVAGDWSFLEDVGKIAVSRSYARKEYGDDNPIGKEITVRRDHYTVGAVIEDYDHSFLEFDLMRKWNQPTIFYYNWLFFKLQEGVTVQNMLDRCEPALQDLFGELPMDHIMQGKMIVPLKDVYRSLAESDEETFIKYDGLELLSKASLLILLCAIVNHFTFFLNYLRGRRREMSLRKVNGASSANIAVQMIFESSIPVLMALFLGLVTAVLLKEPYIRLADIGMTDSYYLKGSVYIMIIVLAVSILLSLIEVLVMNRKNLQSGIRHGNDKAFRRISVGIQIASGMILMFSLAVMIHQFNYMKNLNWGTQRKDTAVVYFLKDGFYTNDGKPYWGDVYMDELESKYGLKDRISALPCVTGVYLNFADMSIMHFGNAALVSADESQGVEEFPNVFDYIYPGLIDRLGLTVLEGSIPQEGLKEDEVVITENLLTALGGHTLEDLPVIYIKLDGGQAARKPFSVVAVIKNIHLYNYDDTPPYILMCGFRNKYLVPESSYGENRAGGSIWGELSVQYRPGTRKELESSIKKMMEELDIDYKIEYPADSFFKHLSKDRNLSKVLSILCLISIFIALFGVFSQISLSCMERRREIAIRKTHGAKAGEILVIFVREYGTIFLVSSAIAMALGYMVMHRWIQQFYYQAAISWWIYLSVFVFTALVIVATVLNRVLCAARENPADVIKSE